MYKGTQQMLATTLESYKTDEEKIAFLDGYLEGCGNYAIWTDGERILGCGSRTMKEETKMVDEIVNDIKTGKF